MWLLFFIAMVVVRTESNKTRVTMRLDSVQIIDTKLGSIVNSIRRAYGLLQPLHIYSDIENQNDNLCESLLLMA